MQAATCTECVEGGDLINVVMTSAETKWILRLSSWHNFARACFGTCDHVSGPVMIEGQLDELGRELCDRAGLPSDTDPWTATPTTELHRYLQENRGRIRKRLEGYKIYGSRIPELQKFVPVAAPTTITSTIEEFDCFETFFRQIVADRGMRDALELKLITPDHCLTTVIERVGRMTVDDPPHMLEYSQDITVVCRQRKLDPADAEKRRLIYEELYATEAKIVQQDKLQWELDAANFEIPAEFR